MFLMGLLACISWLCGILLRQTVPRAGIPASRLVMYMLLLLGALFFVGLCFRVFRD
jgi:hypothetical protein